MIADYLPSPNETSLDDILAARLRLTNFLKEWWPDLDTRPNSVFGDLAMSPGAVLLAGIEAAAAAKDADLDLSKVSRGIITDPVFVRAFLANFGVSEQNTVPASGAIRLAFNQNKVYALDADTSFDFGGVVFKILADEGSPVVISAAGTQGRRVLVRSDENEYVVFLPVTGPAGSTVENGSTANHLLPHPELTGVTAAGDFDPGSAGESLPAMADRARNGYASAHFCSRAGVISFVTHAWPNLVAVSPTITGDREMIRAGANILGVIDGAIDVFVRSSPSYAFGEAVLPLTFDAERRGWIGQLTLPTAPAFFALKSGIFQVGNYLNNRGINTVFAKSTHPTVDNLGVAFSKHETLGILVEDFVPQDFSEAYVKGVVETTDTGAQLSVSGQYAGHPFNSRLDRSVSMRIDAIVTVDGMEALLGRARDEVTGETETIYFLPDRAVSPTFGLVKKLDGGYQRMFNGLNLEIRSSEGTWDTAALLYTRFVFAFKGKTANFQVHYLYEPVLTSLDAAVNDSDNRPVQTSIFAKSFIPCSIDLFQVNYRVRSGDNVDLATARSEIFQYVNTLAWPDIYDESKIGEILTRNGAAGLTGVQKRGLFFPSLANTFISQDGTETAVPREPTTSLLPPQNDLGFGPRNIVYILSLETIQFNGTVF